MLNRLYTSALHHNSWLARNENLPARSDEDPALALPQQTPDRVGVARHQLLQTQMTVPKRDRTSGEQRQSARSNPDTDAATRPNVRLLRNHVQRQQRTQRGEREIFEQIHPNMEVKTHVCHVPVRHMYERQHAALP